MKTYKISNKLIEMEIPHSLSNNKIKKILMTTKEYSEALESEKAFKKLYPNKYQRLKQELKKTNIWDKITHYSKLNGKLIDSKVVPFYNYWKA